MALTDREAPILLLGRQSWRSREVRDEVAADLFGLAPIRYAQVIRRVGPGVGEAR